MTKAVAACLLLAIPMMLFAAIAYFPPMDRASGDTFALLGIVFLQLAAHFKAAK